MSDIIERCENTPAIWQSRPTFRQRKRKRK